MDNFRLINKLFNGGLDPATVDPKLIGERRTISTVSFLVIVSSLVLMTSHLMIFDANYHRVVIVACVLIAAVFSIYAQAFRNWKRLSALSLIASLWLAPVLLMLQEGFSSSNWAWLLTVILLANFIMSRRVSILFTGLSIAVLVMVAYFTAYGNLGYGIEARAHAVTVAVSGSLIFMLACALGYSYRTGQLRSEQQLKHNNATLAKEVEVRRIAELKAQAGERAKATFLTTVSHELRTPLNGVIGASELLASKQLDTETQDLVAIIRDSGEILLEVINNVLDLSRLDEGKLALVYAPADIRAVVHSSIAPLTVLSSEKGLGFNIEIAESVPSLLNADSARIRQLIINLCGNAIKFTSRGQIDVRLDYAKGTLVLIVKDTGIGIEKSVIADIFTPFAQVESSSDRRFGGSGLGLSIVNRLVTLFGGSIDVESTIAVGTTFTVRLPLSAAAPIDKAEKMPADTEINVPQTRQSKILVTDDNEINRKVATELLKKLGHTAIEAKDGLEALSSVEAGDIDLVLMDVQMPNMDGLTATSKIRGLEGRIGRTPIIGLTANAMPGDEAQMRAAGMNGYLSKPVRLEKLRQALSSAGASFF